MGDKDINIIIRIFLVAILLVFGAWLVNAVLFPSTSIKIVSPTTDQNISGTFTFNVSFYNNTGAPPLIDPVNVTFYYNISGTGSGNWTAIGNNSGALNGSCVRGAIGSCTLTVSTLNITQTWGDGYYAINATLWNVSGINTDQFSILNVSNLSVRVLIDNTKPVVFANAANFTPLVSTNNSGVIYINISTFDATAGIRAVIFNITNSSEVQNSTPIGTREGTTNSYSVSINTAGFADGTYNITAIVNDTTTGGNVNSSARVSVVFDNTVPTVSESCSPKIVNVNDVVTCTCTRSDATSGVKTVSHSANPSTSSTGTFTNTCTVTDHAGNSASASDTYTVEQGGGSSSGGDGGGSGGDSGSDSGSDGGSDSSGSQQQWSQTVSQDDVELSEKGAITQTLEATQRVTVKISGESHYVGVKSLTATSATIEIGSTPQEVTLNVGESRKFDTGEDGYYDLEVRLASIEETKANLIIKSIYEKVETTEGEEEPATSSSTLWLIIIVVAVVVVAAIIYYRKRNYK